MCTKNAYIIDTTLRDGEQTPGVAFSVKEKMEIAAILDVLGVDEVEAGTPAIGQAEQEAIKSIASAGFGFKTSCWCRAIAGDIVEAAKMGTQAINISLPVSDIQLATLGKNQIWALSQVREMVSFAKSFFSHVTIGAQDASRASMDFLHLYVTCAVDAGVDRVRIADTVGILDSLETYQLMHDLKAFFPEVQLE